MHMWARSICGYTVYLGWGLNLWLQFNEVAINSEWETQQRRVNGRSIHWNQIYSLCQTEKRSYETACCACDWAMFEENKTKNTTNQKQTMNAELSITCIGIIKIKRGGNDIWKCYIMWFSFSISCHRNSSELWGHRQVAPLVLLGLYREGWGLMSIPWQ